MSRAVVYTRVSGLGQVEGGHGLEVQADHCRAYAERIGMQVAAVKREEGVSGTKDAADRPALAEALAMLASGEADALLVHHLDRLARSVTVQEAVLAVAWDSAGASVHTVAGEVLRDDPDDPMRTAMREMAGVFAGLERRMIVKRLRDGRRRKALNGGHASGSYRYGHDRNGLVAAEQDVLAFIRAHAAQGTSWETIARLLNNKPGEEWATRSGRPWSPANVAKISRAGSSDVPTTQGSQATVSTREGVA